MADLGQEVGDAQRRIDPVAARAVVQAVDDGGLVAFGIGGLGDAQQRHADGEGRALALRQGRRLARHMRTARTRARAAG